MAEVLDKYAFPPRSAGGRRGYPWGEWLDGRIWVLVHGTDFQGVPKNFVSSAIRAARQRGKLIDYDIVEHEGAATEVVIRAREKLPTKKR